MAEEYTIELQKLYVEFLVSDHEYSFDTNDSRAETKIDAFLFEVTSSYYADEIMKWVKSKIKIETPSFW